MLASQLVTDSRIPLSAKPAASAPGSCDCEAFNLWGSDAQDQQSRWPIGCVHRRHLRYAVCVLFSIGVVTFFSSFVFGALGDDFGSVMAKALSKFMFTSHKTFTNRPLSRASKASLVALPVSIASDEDVAQRGDLDPLVFQRTHGLLPGALGVEKTSHSWGVDRAGFAQLSNTRNALVRLRSRIDPIYLDPPQQDFTNLAAIFLADSLLGALIIGLAFLVVMLVRRRSNGHRTSLVEATATQQTWPSMDQCASNANVNNTDPMTHSLAVLLTAATLITSNGVPAYAENELAQVAIEKSPSALVDPTCFETKCEKETTACATNGDCTKGLTCIVKCQGDTQCEVGCFARYQNKALDDTMRCVIEEERCIKIAVIEPGADGPLEAPLPPKPLVDLKAKDMSGTWYKVMGWNPNYDCYDCQRNTFKQRANKKGVDMGVEFSLPRIRVDEPPDVFRTTLLENLQFDNDTRSHRTARTEGTMFGITFWENWYAIGKNKPSEEEFRFMYYNGKTQLNRYEGAFVYTRTSHLPRKALPSIYKIAREAGIDPTKMCYVSNECFDAAAGEAAQPPFTNQAAAAAKTDSSSGIVGQILSRGMADIRTIGERTSYDKNQDVGRRAWKDVTEYLEDPRPFGRQIFEKQNKMSQVLEYDENGYSRSSHPK